MLGRNRPDYIVTDGLPEGWRLEVHKTRRQPFTVWHTDGDVNEVVAFCPTNSFARERVARETRVGA